MSVRQNIADWVSGKSTNTKFVEHPITPSAPVPPPPVFLSAHIKPDTQEFVLVLGAYNFAVMKGFGQPVVGLLNDWVPAYADMHPFATMTRGEIIISRVAPEPLGGSTDTNPEATAAAAKSADLDTNIRMLISLARHAWIRERCILSVDGVFAKAQERFESRHFPTHRKEYFRHFTKLSEVRDRDVPALCAPPAPARPLNPPVLRSARQICKSQSEWDSLRDEDRARLIAAEQSQWQNQYAPSFGNSSRSPTDIGIPAPPPSFDERTDTENWKQPPNASERESIERDDWK